MSGTRNDWRRYCDSPDLTIRRGGIRVSLAVGNRSHEVRVRPSGDGYLLTATIADAETLDRHRDIYEDMWQRNRRSQLVGFRIDEKGSLVAHGWTPEEGVTAEAFQLLVRTVAREADRYELQLTGLDRR